MIINQEKDWVFVYETKLGIHDGKGITIFTVLMPKIHLK